MKIKSWKLQELSKEIENGLDYEGLINLRKKVYNVKVELYSDEWYEKRILLTCIKEFLDECEPIKKESKPTEEEIKKEWEALGYEWKEDKIFITLINQKYDKGIKIDKKLKDYKCYDLFRTPTLLHTLNIALFISSQEHKLLTKTFKMLGWE